MTSPAGVGTDRLSTPSPFSTSPSINQQAMLWGSPLSGDYNDDFLQRYVAGMSPGAGSMRRTSTPISAPPTEVGSSVSSLSRITTPSNLTVPGPPSSSSLGWTPSPSQRSSPRHSFGSIWNRPLGQFSPTPGRITPRGRPNVARKQPRRVPRQNTPSTPSDPGSRRRSSSGSRRRGRRGGGGGGSGGGGSGGGGGGGGSGGGGGGGGGSGGSSGRDNSRGRRLGQNDLQRQLELLINDAVQAGRRQNIAGITTTNTVTTTYKGGGRPEVTRNSTSV